MKTNKLAIIIKQLAASIKCYLLWCLLAGIFGQALRVFHISRRGFKKGRIEWLSYHHKFQQRTKKTFYEITIFKRLGKPSKACYILKNMNILNIIHLLLYNMSEKNIYRINAHIWEEFAQKKIELYLN